MSLPTCPATNPSPVRVEHQLVARPRHMFVILGVLLLAVLTTVPAAAGGGSMPVRADGTSTTVSTGPSDGQRLIVQTGTRAQTSATTSCSIDDSGFALPTPAGGPEYVRLGLDRLAGDVPGSCHDPFSSSTPSATHDRAPPSGAATRAAGPAPSA